MNIICSMNRSSKEVTYKKIAPSGIYFGITQRCNMACEMCMTRNNSIKKDNQEFSSESYIKKRKGHLDRDNIRSKILLPGRKLGLKSLVVSGGEPTLFNRLCHVIKDAICLDYIIFLATNLLKFDEMLFCELFKLLDSRNNAIQISFDSVYSWEMNRIRGKNVYRRVVNNCKKIIKLRRELRIGISFLGFWRMDALFIQFCPSDLSGNNIIRKYCGKIT